MYSPRVDMAQKRLGEYVEKETKISGIHKNSGDFFMRKNILSKKQHFQAKSQKKAENIHEKIIYSPHSAN